MTRKTLLAVTVLTATAIGGTAIAHSYHGHGGQSGSKDRAGMMQDGSGMMGNMGGMSNMMGMMKRMHGQMMGGGMMGGMGPMGGGMMQRLDADGDDTVTGEEMKAPADKVERMRKMRDGMGQMQSGNGGDMGDSD